MTVTGIVLAAGGGTRYGRPKGLVRGPDGEPWVARAVRTLLDGGCAPAVVVLGARADDVAALVPPVAATVVAADWTSGMSASLRAGLLAATGDAALVALVDMPGLTAAAVARLVALASPDALARAGYGGTPGHPVLIGREHRDRVLATLTGDSGAREYLRRHAVRAVECGDVADGRDVDTPDS